MGKRNMRKKLAEEIFQDGEGEEGQEAGGPHGSSRRGGRKMMKSQVRSIRQGSPFGVMDLPENGMGNHFSATGLHI